MTQAQMSESITPTVSSDTLVGAGSVAPVHQDVSLQQPTSTTNDAKKTPDAPSASSIQHQDKTYYTLKIPTVSTAFKSLFKAGKKLAQKAEPLADNALDKVVGGIAKIAGLPDPQTGEKAPEPQQNQKPDADQQAV